MHDATAATVEIKGFYDSYPEVPLEKALAYAKFLASKEGKRWRDEVIFETKQYESNIFELRRHNRGDRFHSN
jgi:hypothetical protein